MSQKPDHDTVHQYTQDPTITYPLKTFLSKACRPTWRNVLFYFLIEPPKPQKTKA